MPLNLRTDIHIVGENNLAFLSQIAFFCKALRRLYQPSEPIRVRCFLGGPDFDWETAPPHVQACRDEIEIIRADPADYARRAFYAQCDDAFLNIREDAQVVVFADADTFWLRRPDTLFDIVHLNRAAAGCMIHYPPPDGSGDAKALWHGLFAQHVGHEPRFDHVCSLQPNSASPFCVNFAFVPMEAELMRRDAKEFIQLVHTLRPKLAYPYFSYQIALALWAAKRRINTVSVPFQYNFPNDDKVFEFSNLEMEDIIAVHYLRKDKFKRSRMFLDADSFMECVDTPGGRADAMLQRILLNVYRVPEWLRRNPNAANYESGNVS